MERLSKNEICTLLGLSVRSFNSLLSELSINPKSKDIDVIELLKRLIELNQSDMDEDDTDEMRTIKIARQKIGLERDRVALDELKSELVNKERYLQKERERVEIMRSTLLNLIPTLQAELKLESYQVDRLKQTIRTSLTELKSTLRLSAVQAVQFINEGVQ